MCIEKYSYMVSIRYEIMKNERMKLFIETHRTGVIEKTVESPHHPHNTRQPGSLYLPTIKPSAYFHSFWPRTTRDIRGDYSSE